MGESKKEVRARKKAYKKARSKAIRPWKWLTWISLPFVVILTVATIVVTLFDNTIALFTGGTFWELENEDPNAPRGHNGVPLYFQNDYPDEVYGEGTVASNGCSAASLPWWLPI